MPQIGSLPRSSSRLLATCVGMGMALIGGCDAAPKGASPPTHTAPRPVESRPTTQPLDEPLASWRGRTLTWNDVRPSLAELAGATALRDAFLDFRIEQA